MALDQKKPSFVVVDDDVHLLNILKDALSMHGNECDVFTSAEAALHHMTDTPCDILITDIVMQGMKGLQLTRKVKLTWPDTNVIVMTGFIDDFSYDQAIAAGASDFIEKPFTVQEIISRIKHVLLQARLREMSNTDELTGLLNRRGFLAIAQQQLKMAKRTKGHMTLVFADMDKFKDINDRWGHQKGDEALVAMADIFKQTIRDSDPLARISGDEFAILLPDMHEDQFIILSSRLQKKLDSYNGRSDGTFTLSLSIGMASYDHDRPCSIDELLRQADRRMYEQKQRKRNAITA